MDSTTCDLCGKPDASRVELGVSYYDAVSPGQPTTHTEAVDACDACRDTAITKLTAHAQATLAEQVPLHRKLWGDDGIERRREAIQATIRLSAAPLLAYDEAQQRSRTPLPPPDELLVPHKQNLLDLAAVEAERGAALEEANTLHGERVAAFKASLRKD